MEVDISQLDVADIGDVHYLTGESMASYGEKLEWVAKALVTSGFVPIALGGDHSVSRFLLRPHLSSQRKTGLGIVHFDAHTDLYDFPGAVSHGNPFQEALDSKSLARLHQIGLRQIRTDRGRPVVDPRLSFVSSFESQKLAPAEIFANLDRSIPYYVTFDVDSLSMSEMSETGTPVAGGLSYYQVFDMLHWVVKNLNVVGFDFVEVTGPVLPTNRAAIVCATLAARILVDSGRPAPLASQLFRVEAGTSRRSK